MIIVNHREGALILNGEKVDTCRPIKADNKGYLKTGTVQKVYGSRNFKKAPICKVLILNVSFVNIDYLSLKDFRRLGYGSKAEYMEQPYNQRQESPLRIRYSFITLQELLALVESLEVTPANFLYVLNYCHSNPSIFEGVGVGEIVENCDPEALEDAFITVEANLRGLIDE